MIKLFWNTQNQITPTSNDPNKEDVFDHQWGVYHKVSSDEWIFFLLKKIRYKIILNLDDLAKDDVLIIIDSSVEKKKQLYLKLRLICSKIFLFHLGDEVGMINNSHIYDNCDYVWRTFCANKYFKDENLSCLPMGHKTGIYHRKEIQDRKYRWSFIGTPHKSSRHDLLFQFSKIKPSFIFRTKKFNDKKIIEANEMSEILSSTHFMPCPNGFVHPESYRLYEALECQCIPIIEDSYKYYDRLLPGNPFLKVNKWLDAKEIITNWTREQITKKREECSFWWNQYKLNLQEEISKKIRL